MPKLGPRARATAFLLLRLAVFAFVTWWAIHWILLRETAERDFVSDSKEGFKATFRSPAPGVQTRDLILFGKNVFSLTRERWEVDGGKRLRNARGPLLWVKDGDEFYPQAKSGAMFKTEGTNYVDYAVLPPEGREWLFKVEHRITRKIELGPFKFEAAPQNIIYRSPVMTNSLASAD